MPNFVPQFHFVDPNSKLTPDWCEKSIDYYWHNTHNKSLLDGKDTLEIESYVAGEFDLKPFYTMYKSMENEEEKRGHPNYQKRKKGSTGFDWQCLSLITDKFNSATSLIQKIPVEMRVKALDPLAAEKKNEDINFLKNKPEIEADLQPIHDKLQLGGKVDLGTTKHSSVPFSDNPYGLDLNEPEELEVFVSLLYNLKVEASFETILDIFWKLNNANQVKLLEIRDQFKYGVSCNWCYPSSLTGLPEIKYCYPGNVKVPDSDLPDYSDRTHTFFLDNPTVLELFNYFKDEICNEEKLREIINGNGGYCSANKRPRLDFGTFDKAKVSLVYCEVKTVDAIGITGNPKSKKGYRYFTSEPEEVKNCKDKITAQNTICFWWLENTKHFFGIHKLGSATRKKGLESYQGFSISIMKTQPISAVELAIRENKLAQESYIKMQHAIRKSGPAGFVLDLRFVRGALSGLKEEVNEETMQRLITQAIENKIVLIDTENFDGKNDGQFKPYIDIPGGLKSEIVGYMQAIANHDRNINKYMGTNEQVTGQAYQELVGNNEMAVNASLNSINYVSDAVQYQAQNVYNIWSFQIKDAVEQGGELKKSIVNMIGSEKVNLIDAIEDFGSHQMSVDIKIESRPEMKLQLDRAVYNLKLKGVLTEADDYMLSQITNPRDRWALVAVKEKQALRRAEQIRKEQFAQQQQMIQQQGQNALAVQQQEDEGDIKKLYAKADGQAKIIQMSKQMDQMAMQLQAMIDRDLQDRRNNGQTQKGVSLLEAKKNMEQQQAFG